MIHKTILAALLFIPLSVLLLNSQDLDIIDNKVGVNQGTIEDKPDLNATDDAIRLRKAMKGIGTDEGGVINIITERSNSDRQKIASVFKNMYSKELAYKFQHEFSYHGLEVLKDLLVPPIDYDAQVIKSSMKGAGTDLDSITSVLCSKSSPQIEEIKNAYQRLYRTRMEDDLRRDVSEPLLNLYIQLINNRREQGINDAEVQKDIQDAMATNVKNLSPDNAIFKILATRSKEHIMRVLEGFAKSQNTTLNALLDQDLSGAITKQGKTVRTVKNLLECYASPPKFYAQQIANAVKGAGTNDKKMFRLMIARSEIDLNLIKDEFKKLTNTDLSEKIKKETTGTYKNLLLGLLKGNKA